MEQIVHMIFHSICVSLFIACILVIILKILCPDWFEDDDGEN